jgi:hypothetical protein
MLKIQPTKEALKFGASSAPSIVDVHQYVALVHGLDVEKVFREEKESSNSNYWIRRSFVLEGHEEWSVAIELPCSSFHTTTLFFNPTKASVANKTH